MEIAMCTKPDFDEILNNIAEFWSSDLVVPLHHPMFLSEFGDTAYVIREGAQVVAACPRPPTAEL